MATLPVLNDSFDAVSNLLTSMGYAGIAAGHSE
jgi:hypothetical protein